MKNTKRIAAIVLVALMLLVYATALAKGITMPDGVKLTSKYLYIDEKVFEGFFGGTVSLNGVELTGKSAVWSQQRRELQIPRSVLGEGTLGDFKIKAVVGSSWVEFDLTDPMTSYTVHLNDIDRIKFRNIDMSGAEDGVEISSAPTPSASPTAAASMAW